MNPKSDLFLRYEKACDFNREPDHDKIEYSLKHFFKIIGVDISVRKIGSFEEAVEPLRAALDAWDARDAWDAWAARAARDARDARDAWDARAARDAWDARAARDAWAARAARAAWDAWAARAARAAWDARDAWDARAAWDASYDSLVVIGAENKGDEKLKEKWLPYFEAFEAGAWITFHLDREVLYFPIPKLFKNTQNRLHKEGGPALILPNEKWWFLNGVNVPQELVMTPAEKLDPIFLNKEKNADVKAEFIRKYGIERLVSHGKIVDSYKNYQEEWFTKSEYELVDMSPLFSRLNFAPYLKMKNQSVPGVFHLEAVPRTIKTVKEAVNFRTKSKNPTIINIK